MSTLEAPPPKPGLALYLHWPWCLRKCPYCDFNSHVPKGEMGAQTQAYNQAVLNELAAWNAWRQPGQPAEALPNNLVSIFIGGGTPSLMPPEMVAEWVRAAKCLGTANEDLEVTLECNPTSLLGRDARQHFAQLRQAGVNRVSVGVQALHAPFLSFLGRTHDIGQARTTIEAAQAEIARVNVDLIYGLPGQTLTAWQQDLAEAASWGIGHLSAYQLTIEPNTHFAAAVRQKTWQPVDADTEADFFEATHETLAYLGLEAYEISNFARPGEACQHNLHVWRYGSYLGCGAGAHGRTAWQGQVLATQARRMPDDYQRAWQHVSHPEHTPSPSDLWAGWTPLPASLAAQEALMMGLRLKGGINTACWPKPLHDALHDAIDLDGLRLCQSMGWLEVAGSTWRLTHAGWPRLNGVLGLLLPRTTLVTASAVQAPLS